MRGQKFFHFFSFFYCLQIFFWYNAKLKIILNGGYGNRFKNKIASLPQGGD